MPADDRPLSPHLQVYRLPLVALMSVVHRASGLVLATGLVLWAWWLGAAASGPGPFATFHLVFGTILGRLVLLGFSVALFYHLANGIRHLSWDAGHGLDLPGARRSGRMVIVATVVLTVAAWVAALI
jgi:succinate dehydrogenase / fumarate reductase cytochrome b subunit